MINARRGLMVYSLLASFGRAFTISSDTMFFLSKGLTFGSISTLEIVLLVAMMILELPSGIIADRFGRKIALLISCGVRVAAYLFIIGTARFGSFAVAYLFLGVGMAFQSGAMNAWVVDAQQAEGACARTDKAAIQHRLVTLSMVNQIGNASGALTGSLAFALRPALPWMGSLLVFLLAAVVLVWTREPERLAVPAGGVMSPSPFVPLRPFSCHLKEAMGLYWKRPILVWITAIACVGQIGMTGIIKIWQPWFASLLGHGGEAWLGVIWMSFVGANLVANLAVKRTMHLQDSRRLLVGSILSGLPLLGFAFTRLLPLALPLYMLHVFGEAYKDPILLGILHDEVDGKNRATVESFYSLSGSLAEALGFVFMGFAIDRWGMQVVVCLCAVLFVGSGAFANGRIDRPYGLGKGA